MGKYKLLIAGLVLSVGATLGLATVSQAQWSDNIQGQDRVTVAVDQTHSGSLYAAGDQVLIDGTVEGDLYCAARELIISDDAEVTGDVFCAVQMATIDGQVGQDVRIAGQYLSIDNTVDGSVSFFGQELKLLADSNVAGDVNGAGQIFNLGGPVGGDVVAGVERLSLQSTVGGNVDVGVNRIEMLGGARVGGDLNYSAESTATIDEARVGGQVSFNQETSSQQSDGGMVGWLAYLLGTMLACALVLALVAPQFVERSRRIAASRFAIVSLAGFAVVFGTPILAVMLMVTVVLLPVGMLLLLLWASALLVSHGLFAYLLGSLAYGRQRSILIRMIVGIAMLFVLYIIPVVNVFAVVIATVIGSGMAVSTITDGYRTPQYRLEDPVAKKPATKKRK